MDPAPRSSSPLSKTLAAILLVGLGLVGLAMSLCGGFFTGFSLLELLGPGTPSGEAKEYAKMFIVIGSPSFVLGLLVMFLTVVAWKRTVAR